MSGLFQHEVRVRLIVLLLSAVMGLSSTTVVQAACGTDPTVSFDETALDVLPGNSTSYTVSITNTSGSSCDFDLSTTDTDGDFTSSLPGATFTVAGGATDSFTLSVAAINEFESRGSVAGPGSGPLPDAAQTPWRYLGRFRLTGLE